MTERLISLRVDPTVPDRAAALAERLAKEPEVLAGAGRITRSYVLRVALERGLSSLEDEFGPKRRRRKRS